MANQYKDIPQPGDILSNSQGDIEHNFLYLTNTLGTSLSATKDHQISVSGTDTTTFEGRHLHVSLKDQAGNPAHPGDGTDMFVWSNAGNLFCRNATTGPYQLTTVNSGGTFGNTTTGWTFLPGGLILNYGKVTGNSGAWPAGTQTLIYNAPNIHFPTTGFGVMTTFIGPTSSSTGDIAIIATNTANFTWVFTGSSSSSFDGFYWWSIGN